MNEEIDNLNYLYVFAEYLEEKYFDHIYKVEIRNYYYCSRESKKF